MHAIIFQKTTCVDSQSLELPNSGETVWVALGVELKIFPMQNDVLFTVLIYGQKFAQGKVLLLDESDHLRND